MEGCLISFHFHFSFVARFALIIFWMITTQQHYKVAKRQKKQKKSTRVESLIIQHLPIIEHFPIFSHSLIKLSNFCVIACAN